MNNSSFDSLTRRTSLLTLGASGWAGVAVLASPGAANAKKNPIKKKAKQKCKKQVGQCTTSLTTNCQGNPQCLAFVRQCCPLLGSCDMPGFWDCLLPGA